MKASNQTTRKAAGTITQAQARKLLAAAGNALYYISDERPDDAEARRLLRAAISEIKGR